MVKGSAPMHRSREQQQTVAAGVPSTRVLSGPVSVHVFDVPVAGGSVNRIYVLGDEHHSYDNMCSPCTDVAGCATVTEFVRRRLDLARSRGTALDAYMEMPYVLPSGPTRDALISMWDGLMKRDEGASSAARGGNKKSRGLLDRLIGNNPFYVGVFSRLYKEFGGEFYGEPVKHTRDGARFHYCDARHEPNVSAFMGMSPAVFHTHVASINAMRGFMHAFVYGLDFPADMARIFGAPTTQKLVVREALSSVLPGGPRVVHKIAKQFHRLTDGPAKTAAKAYLDARIEDTLDILRHDLGFDAGAHMYAAPHKGAAPHTAYEPWLPMLRSWHRRYYDVAFELCMRLGVRVVLMDAYLVCRMLRFSVQAGRGGESIVYVGDAHAEFYVRMLTEHMGLSPSVCVARSAAPTGGSRRCVRLDGPRCAPKSV